MGWDELTIPSRVNISISTWSIWNNTKKYLPLPIPRWLFHGIVTSNSHASLNLDSTQCWHWSYQSCFQALHCQHVSVISPPPVAHEKTLSKLVKMIQTETPLSQPLLNLTWTSTGVLNPLPFNHEQIIPSQMFPFFRAFVFGSATSQESYSMLPLFFSPQEKKLACISHSLAQHCFHSCVLCSLNSFLYYIKLHFCVESTEIFGQMQSLLLVLLTDSVILYFSICIYPYSIPVNYCRLLKMSTFCIHCSWIASCSQPWIMRKNPLCFPV